MSNSYAPKVPMTDDEIQRWKPVCADFVSFRAGVRAAERAYNVGDLVRQANHYMDEWSNVCNENQRMLNRIASLEAERDQLRAEVERLRKPLTDEQIREQFEDSIKRSAVAATTPLGVITINDAFHHYADPDTDTMWLGYRAGFKRARAIEAAKEAK